MQTIVRSYFIARIITHSSAIEIIDQMLEDYVGIRDRELSLSIYESGTKSSDSGSFLDTVTRYSKLPVHAYFTCLALIQCSRSRTNSSSTFGTSFLMLSRASCQKSQHNSSFLQFSDSICLLTPNAMILFLH